MGRIFGEPFGDTSAVPTFAVCALASRHAKVAVSGDGGDEVLGGYRRYQWHRMTEAVRAWLPAGVRRHVVGQLARIYPKMDSAPRWLRAKYTLTELSLDSALSYFRMVTKVHHETRRALFAPAVLAELDGYDPGARIQAAMDSVDDRDPLRQAQVADIDTYLVGDILTKVDRASMANSLEVRAPLLDHRFVEWGLGLPPALKLHRGTGKYVFRRAMEDRLPADFGVVALGAAFVSAVEALTFIGVEEALVRQKVLTRAHYDTGFTLNAIRGVFLSLLLIGLVVPAAGFFGEPRMSEVLFFLALATFATAFTNISLIDFRRDFAFHREFAVLFVPRIISMTLFRSYWALIVGILSQCSVTVVIGYVMHPYRPRFSVAAWDDLAGYSMWNWITALANLVRERSNAFMLGHVMGAAQVGVYAIGSEVALLPTTELISPFARAAFSGFSAARNEGDDTALTFLQMVGGVMMLSLPAGFGLSLLADPLVALAFGPLWTDAVPVVQVLGAAGALSVFSYLAGTFLNAHALLRTVLAISVAGAAVRVGLLVLLLVVWPWGLTGSAVSVAASVLVGDVLCVAVMRRRFGVTLGMLASQMWRSFAATAAMTACLLATGLGGQAILGGAAAQVWYLAAGVLVGAGSYTASLLAFWLLAGRPDGGETHVLRMVGMVVTHAGARLRRS